MSRFLKKIVLCKKLHVIPEDCNQILTSMGISVLTHTIFLFSLLQVKETYVQKMGSEYPLFCSFPQIHITHSTLFIDDISMSRTGMMSQMTQTVDEVSESVHQLVNNLNQRQPQQQNSLMLLRRQFPVLRSLARCVDMNWLAILVCFLCYCCLCSDVSCKYVIFFNNLHFVHGQIA